MTQVPVEIPETVSGSGGSRRFVDLRGVQWRVDLGILPSSPSSSIDDLRRVTANSRRRYAALRRQLLVDTHVPKDGSNSPDLVMDNPLSQNPDSMWGRFFKNAELERMIDQDLARLYPERGSYFQSSECQGMLRRMLLLWCLRHPEYGYRQGMHELLAPLLYVLHVDVERLSEVRKAHEDHFADKFDSFSFHENDLTYKFDFKKFSESSENWNGFEKNSGKSGSPSERDPEIQTIVLLTDAYGAEGDLGIVISDKFMEHDAYSMFDALMNGAGGVVAMAEFFSPLTFSRANTGIPPVIEASGSLYHLLSVVDSSLHSHLIELGVEPQYFALRWLRVLFGREFYLEDLLVIWDEIFSHENAKFIKATDSNEESYSGVLCSSRGGFISAFAVSMMLNLRSSLLATNNATTCLQRLLNFSDTVNLVKLIKKAKSLQGLAVEANKSNSLIIHSGLHDSRKSTNHRGHSLSLDLAASPQTSLNMVPVKILRGAFKMKGWLNPPTDESTGETNKAPKPPLVVEASTHESSIVGFYEQFSQIKNWLTDSTHDRLQVLNIVGMAGIGKTTLARILFEPAATDYKFKIHVWASPSVSRTNNVQTVIRGILDSIRPKEDEVLDDKSIEQLTGILHRSLKGMRYLIVLDDVWDIQLWDDIKTSFPDDYTRSRIILTTRLTEMDFEDQLCRTHRMRLLTPNYSWTLFCMKVFGEEKCPQELKYDAKHISGNCGGLPLAIVVIGGLLSKVSRNKDDWQLIASSTNSMVTSTEELKEILSLGYKYLPLHLRACFRYMIIFLVEDYELAVARLVRLWIDEGLVDQLGSKSLEEVVDEYLKDLIDRGLVMVCKRNENGDAETCGISSIWKDYFMAENPDILQILLSKSNQSTTPKEGMEDLPRTYSEGVSMKVEEEQKGEIKLAKSLDISMDILFNNRYTKDCIRYCSLFPTTFEFTKDILVSLWIAQGWTTAGNDAFIEEACIQCFDILLKGRYIVPTGYDPHGDRIKYKVGEEMDAFLQDHLIRPQFSKELDGNYIEDFKLQHLSLSFKDIGQINFQIIKNLNRLQTLIIHGCYGFKATHLPFDLFRELKSLRILSISHTDVVELPSSIECSKELRYLDMSETPIRWLPESICNLSNLQTLELDNCLGLIRLPKRVKQLINLRHLILDIPRQLQSMPEGLGKLSKLRTLRAFFVGEEDGYTINELKQMNKLSGSLRILKLENIKTPEQAADASLCSKQDLKKIELQWSDLQDEINRDEEEILTRLEPPLGIQELKILYYSGGKLPSWIGNPSFSEMVSITLHKCRYCTSLPFLGQLPSLKFLNIIGMDEVKDVNKLFCGGKGINQHQPSFPALDKLTLDSMPELEIWTTEIRIGDFPCLMNLTIESCPKINCLPSLSNLKSLMHMEISYCPELSCLPDGRLPSTLESLMIRDSPKLNERCSNSQGEDWPKIAHVPIFYIDNMEVHTK